MPRIHWLSLFALFLSACASVAPPAGTECFHTNAAVETEIGFCEAERVGNTLYISGTVGNGEMPQAIKKAYTSLQKTLAARGLDFRNVVKETVYTTDLDAFIQNKELRKQFYGNSLPAATWVQVSRLYQPAFVVEVELTAVFPK
jgi:enamine deaminase RidA (YjgF/YER057c/UK114 family)